MAQNTIYRALNEKLGGRNVSEYVGNAGELFWDPDTGNLRMSDGTTVGGIGVAESSPWAEDIFLGPWVHFVRPDDSPETLDVIIPGALEIARNPEGEGWGSIYNAVEDDNGGTNNPYGTAWNTDGWGDLTNIKTRYYEDLSSARDGSGWKYPHFEWVMRFSDPTTETYRYYLIRFLTWDSGVSDVTGAFSWVRREINANAFFARADFNNDEEGALVTGDEIAPNLILTRGTGGGLFNWGVIPDTEGERWETSDNDNAPHGTLWNWDGWDDLQNLKSRDFRPMGDLLYAQNWYGKIIVGREFIMWDTLNDAYYAIKFTRWQKITGGTDYPGFSYIRRKIDLEKLSHGLKFEDGTTQRTAYTTKAAGTIEQAPYATAQVEERWINADDIGKIIVLDGDTTNEIRIPDTSTLQWPLFGVVTILNMTGNDIYIYKDNDDESGTIYGSGTGNSSTAWLVPDTGGYNLVTLMKIEQGMDGYYNDYLLVGSGIETN